MRLFLLLIALNIAPDQNHQYPVHDDKENIIISCDLLTIKSKFQHKLNKWTYTNQDTLKVGENKFYYILEEGLVAELKIIKY